MFWETCWWYFLEALRTNLQSNPRLIPVHIFSVKQLLEKIFSERVFLKHTLSQTFQFNNNLLADRNNPFLFSTSYSNFVLSPDPHSEKSSITSLCLKCCSLNIIYKCKIKYLFWVCVLLHALFQPPPNFLLEAVSVICLYFKSIYWEIDQNPIWSAACC